MPRDRFTLAALATLAVPGLDVAVTRTFTGGGDGGFDAALLTDRSGLHYVVRSPRRPEAAATLEAEGRVLTALTAGARARLPFAAPTIVGSLGRPVTVVAGYVPGSRLRPNTVRAGGGLALSIGRAVAAVHDLPTGLAAEHALPSQSNRKAATAVRELVTRTEATGVVPVALTDRWAAAAADDALWQFRPTIVHGRLAADDVLVAAGDDGDSAVSGMLGWSALALGDPAKDLAWALGLPQPGAAGTVLESYRTARRQAPDPELQRRALLYAELELARWLLHGADAHDQRVMDDAVGMLDALADGVAQHTAGSLAPETLPPLTLAEVERLLDSRR